MGLYESHYCTGMPGLCVVIDTGPLAQQATGSRQLLLQGQKAVEHAKGFELHGPTSLKPPTD